ncbi:MAG: glycosyltransferase 87 family protein, partial [Opitutus sp.]
LAAILVSPPVVLAVVRGNNDLVIFVLLAVCGAVLAGENKYRWLVAALGIGLATGLKYYPVVAVLALLWFRPVRQVPVVFGAGLLVAGLALVSVLPDLNHAPLAVPAGIHTMGAPVWWRDFGWTDAQARIPAVLLFVAAGVLLIRTGVTAGLATRGEPRERVLAVTSISLLLACFISGVNYSYRWIFVVWVALWLWRRAGEQLPGRQHYAAVIACGLVFISIWADGVLCLVVNQLPPKSPAWIEHLLLVHRAWTQPLQWLLMALLAGWLLEAVLALGREWRAQRTAA